MDKAERNGSSSRSALRRRAAALSLTVLLIQACASGDVAAVADLVTEKNADPFARDESGRTPLGVAREAGHIEVIKFLMERDKERRALRGAGGTTSTYTAQPTGLSGVATPSRKRRRGSGLGLCTLFFFLIHSMIPAF